MKKHFIYSLFIISILTSCEMFDYHPYDTHITGEKNINDKNIVIIESRLASKDTIRFVGTGDSQRWYDETEDLVKNINARGDVDFVIHGGDISDFGITDEFEWQRDILSKLNCPYVVVIGNHDYLGTGEDAFEAVFGQHNFTFVAGKTRFVCIDTNYNDNEDPSVPLPDFTFLENIITDTLDTSYEKSVICMHGVPYTEVFNNNVAKPFALYCHNLRNLLFGVGAHEHVTKNKEIDGIKYYISTCQKDREYNLFTITPSGYEVETINF